MRSLTPGEDGIGRSRGRATALRRSRVAPISTPATYPHSLVPSPEEGLIPCPLVHYWTRCTAPGSPPPKGQELTPSLSPCQDDEGVPTQAGPSPRHTRRVHGPATEGQAIGISDLG